ncbi:hypothetical protein B484DRAFT_405612, partial [Ochromonadaceae sp. CCMP2298]
VLKNLAYLNLSANPLSTLPLSPVLLRMPWLEVCGVDIPERGCRQYLVTPDEELQLGNLLKGRAASSITSKLRRRKKKSNY